MNLISFHPFRTIGIPGVTYIKPEHIFREIDRIKEADYILFPEKWQLPILVHGLKKNIFPSYESIVLGHNKIDMTRALQTVCPEHVPYTEIHGNTESKRKEILSTFPLPFVLKESRNSMGNGVYFIQTEEEFLQISQGKEDLYVQEYLENDRELRICVVGNQIISSYWKIAENHQFHHNVSKGANVSFDAVPKVAEEFVLDVAAQLNINYAGFDILLMEGKPFVLEFNTLFGNQGLRMNNKRVEDYIYEHLIFEYHHPHPSAPLNNRGIS
ncbi:hypothetical protein RZN22_05805 [Bacillaceae bacterium S4-13-58]